MIDGCSVVDRSSSCFFCALEGVRRVLFGEHCTVKVKFHIPKLGKVPRDNGLYSMIDLISEYTESNGLRKAKARHSRFQMPASAYVSGYSVLTLTTDTLSSAVLLSGPSSQLSQHPAAKVGFYGAEKI